MIRTARIGDTVVVSASKSIYNISRKSRVAVLDKIANKIVDDLSENQDRELVSASYAAEFRTNAFF